MEKVSDDGGSQGWGPVSSQDAGRSAIEAEIGVHGEDRFVVRPRLGRETTGPEGKTKVVGGRPYSVATSRTAVKSLRPLTPCRRS